MQVKQALMNFPVIPRGHLLALQRVRFQCQHHDPVARRSRLSAVHDADVHRAGRQLGRHAHRSRLPRPRTRAVLVLQVRPAD